MMLNYKKLLVIPLGIPGWALGLGLRSLGFRDSGVESGR